MQSASRYNLSRLRALRRSHIAVLALALCVWMIGIASHIHSDADHLVSDAPSTACSFCLSLPVGAPAPVVAAPARAILIAADVVRAPVAALVSLDVPAFYLSRGPPAR
jgi:hypothetical protein